MKNGVKNIQTPGFNGTHAVSENYEPVNFKIKISFKNCCKWTSNKEREEKKVLPQELGQIIPYQKEIPSIPFA